MLKLLRWLLAIVGGLLIILFAVANRAPIEVSFWPLPIRQELPLYGVMFIGLFVGVVLGGLAVWLSSWSLRRQARRDHRRVVAIEARERLRREQEELAEHERARRRREGAVALPAPAR